MFYIVFGVGNNDLANKSVEKCISDMKCLIQKAVGKDECIVHVLPCFERIGKSDFNEKVYKFNGAVEELCESQSKVHYIRNSESLTSKFENALMKDGVHFNTTGQRELVRMIKRHLNPHLGLQPYNIAPSREQGRRFDPPPFRRYQEPTYPPSRPFGGPPPPRFQHNSNHQEINNVLHHLLRLIN